MKRCIGRIQHSVAEQIIAETVSYILDYLRNALLYETVSTEKNDFLLVHAGLGNFDKDKNCPAMPPT